MLRIRMQLCEKKLLHTVEQIQSGSSSSTYMPFKRDTTVDHRTQLITYIDGSWPVATAVPLCCCEPYIRLDYKYLSSLTSSLRYFGGGRLTQNEKTP